MQSQKEKKSLKLGACRRLRKADSHELAQRGVRSVRAPCGQQRAGAGYAPVLAWGLGKEPGTEMASFLPVTQKTQMWMFFPLEQS